MEVIHQIDKVNTLGSNFIATFRAADIIKSCGEFYSFEYSLNGEIRDTLICD